MTGRRQIETPILQPAIQSTSVLDGWKKVRLSTGDKIAEIRDEHDPLTAQRFVVQTQQHPPVLFEYRYSAPLPLKYPHFHRI